MKKLLILMSLMLVLLASCNKNVFYAEEQDVDERGWHMDDGLLFPVNVTDSIGVYNVFLDVRNSVNFDKANTFFFITTTFPDGSKAYDTLECPLADVEGHWYGKRTGRYVDNRYYFRKHVIFPSTGTYYFNITHGMRDTNLMGLKSVGMRIERATATR